MTTVEIITVGLTCLAIVVSVAAIIVAWSARSTANTIRGENLKLSQAQVEMNMRSQVNEARHRVEDFFEIHGDFLAMVKKGGSKVTKADKERTERLKVGGESRVERYLGALDETCQKYNDGKVDVVRFKKAWQNIIRQAVKDDAHNDFLQPGHTLHALMGVYEKWENPEK